MVDIAIMGHGVVGSGVAEVLLGNADSIAKRAADDINVKYILDLRDFDSLPYSNKFIKDFELIANDDDIKIVVEVMGGINPAYDFEKGDISAINSFHGEYLSNYSWAEYTTGKYAKIIKFQITFVLRENINF